MRVINWVIPWEDEGDDGGGGGAARDEAFAAAKASRDAVKDGVAEEEEGDGGEAVDGGGVGGVMAEGLVVVLVGDHFGLKRNQIWELNCGNQSERGVGLPRYDVVRRQRRRRRLWDAERWWGLKWLQKLPWFLSFSHSTHCLFCAYVVMSLASSHSL